MQGHVQPGIQQVRKIEGGGQFTATLLGAETPVHVGAGAPSGFPGQLDIAEKQAQCIVFDLSIEKRSPATKQRRFDRAAQLKVSLQAPSYAVQPRHKISENTQVTQNYMQTAFDISFLPGLDVRQFQVQVDFSIPWQRHIKIS